MHPERKFKSSMLFPSLDGRPSLRLSPPVPWLNQQHPQLPLFRPSDSPTSFRSQGTLAVCSAWGAVPQASTRLPHSPSSSLCSEASQFQLSSLPPFPPHSVFLHGVHYLTCLMHFCCSLPSRMIKSCLSFPCCFLVHPEQCLAHVRYPRSVC